jgi:hypothetical protein
MKTRLLLIQAAVHLACSQPALAADFQISATTVGQGYELGAADGSVVARRRLTQFVRLNGFNLLDDNRLFFVSSFRLDADFGITDTDLAIPGSQYLRQGIRELERLNLSLLYAYLAGRGFYGRIDFDAGRQLVVDLVDFFHFDGVRVAVNTPWYFGIEALAGYEVRAGAALGVSAFDLPGVAEAADRAPTFGVGVFLRDLHSGSYGITGKVTYRKTQATRSLASCARDPSSRADCDRLSAASSEADRADVERAFARDLVIEERISANVQIRLASTHLWGGVSYNLVNGWLDDLLVGAQQRLVRGRLLLETEYLRSRPRFDADSIFNIFGTNAFDDLRFKVGWTFDGGYDLYTRGYVRFFHAERISGAASDGVSARGIVVGARIPHGRRAFTTLDLLAQAGYGGYLFGGDAWSRFSVLDGKLDLDGRLLVLRFDDDRLENLHGINVTLQGGARWNLHRYVSLHLILEESMNRIYTSVFRVYGLVDLNVWL